MEQQQRRKTKRVLSNPAYKDRATILKTSHETGGLYSLGELEVAPGGGNNPHIHTAFVETFTAVKGILGVMYQDKKLYLKPGDSLSIPLRTPHYFFNAGTEPITCHVQLTPGHEGFEKGIAIAYGLTADGKAGKNGFPKSLTHLALVIDLTDTRPAGTMGLLMPLFSWLARRARRKGIEAALLEKYYYL